MAIREKGYTGWEGELKPSSQLWLPIFFSGIKTIFKKKYAKLIFGGVTFPFLIFLIAVYVRTKPELRLLSGLVRQLATDASLFNLFFTNGFLIFMLFIFCIFAGAELIAADLRFNALALYFSRPLDRLDYIGGKFSILLFYLLLFTLVPGLLLVAFKMIFSGSLSFSPLLLLAILVYPFILSMFLASFTLMLSSLTANAKFTRIIILLLYIFMDALAQMLRTVFKSDYFNLFSIQRNITQVGNLLFNKGQSAWNFPSWLSLLTILGLTLVFSAVLFLRIRRAEG